MWKVRRVTEHTHRLPVAGATYVDFKLAPIAHDCSFAQIEGTARKPVEEFDHETPRGTSTANATRYQHLDIALDDAAPLNHGLVPISGLLELSDALALEEAIEDRAHALLAAPAGPRARHPPRPRPSASSPTPPPPVATGPVPGSW